MPKNPLVHLEGAEELNRALRSVGDRAGGITLRNAAEAGADVIAEQARANAPRDTGALAEGITTQAGRIQQGRAVINIGYRKAQWYGQFVELGTEHAAAHPFLRPALDSTATEATDTIGAVMRAALKDVL